jgi:hypothetical protein
VNPQHALKANGRVAVAAFRVIWLDHGAQFGPRHDRIYGVEKLVAPLAFASRLESRTLICGHRKRLLLDRLLPVSLHVQSTTPKVHARWT